MSGNAQPLVGNQPIVNSDGTPNAYFTKWAQQRQIDITSGVTIEQVEQYVAEWAAARQIIAGTGLDGGGDLSADVTLNLADTTVDPGTYGDATNSAQITVDQQGRITTAVNVPITGGGGGGGSTPTIKSSSIQSSSASSYVVVFPGSPAAGDLAIIFAQTAYSITVPVGWFGVDVHNNNTNVDGACIAKILTASDITTGSVTISIGGTFNSCFACVIINGVTFKNFQLPGQFLQSATGATSATIGNATQNSTSLNLAFIANRGASNNTLAIGTQLRTINTANSSGSLYEILGVSGLFTTNASFSSAGSGYYTALIALIGP